MALVKASAFSSCVSRNPLAACAVPVQRRFFAALPLPPRRDAPYLPPGARKLEDAPLPPETWDQKLVRWLDITGFFSKYNNRKFHLLWMDPMKRIENSSATEFERQYFQWMHLNTLIMTVVGFSIIFYEWHHHMAKPPEPHYGSAPKSDWKGFTFKSVFMWPAKRCYHCDPRDYECKKECLDNLREEEGYKFLTDYIVTSHSVPRAQLKPPHFQPAHHH